MNMSESFYLRNDSTYGWVVSLHDSFICVVALWIWIESCTYETTLRMNESFHCMMHCECHDSFVCDLTVLMWHDSFMCDVSHPYMERPIDMRHDLSTVTWLIHDMTHPHAIWLIHMWHDSFVCVFQWFSCEMTVTWLVLAWLIHRWNDSSICQTTH